MLVAHSRRWIVSLISSSPPSDSSIIYITHYNALNSYLNKNLTKKKLYINSIYPLYAHYICYVYSINLYMHEPEFCTPPCSKQEGMVYLSSERLSCSLKLILFLFVDNVFYY